MIVSQATFDYFPNLSDLSDHDRNLFLGVDEDPDCDYADGATPGSLDSTVRFTKLRPTGILASATIPTNSLITCSDGTMFRDAGDQGLQVIGSLYRAVVRTCNGDPLTTAKFMQLLRNIARGNAERVGPTPIIALCRQPRGPQTHHFAMAAYLQQPDEMPPMAKVLPADDDATYRIWEHSLLGPPAGGMRITRKGEAEFTANTMATFQNRLQAFHRAEDCAAPWAGSYPCTEEELEDEAREDDQNFKEARDLAATEANKANQREGNRFKRAKGRARSSGLSRQQVMPTASGSIPADSAPQSSGSLRNLERQIQDLASSVSSVRDQLAATTHEDRPPRRAVVSNQAPRLYYTSLKSHNDWLCYVAVANQITMQRINVIQGHGPLTAQQTWKCEAVMAPMPCMEPTDAHAVDLPINVHDSSKAAAAGQYRLEALLRPMSHADDILDVLAQHFQLPRHQPIAYTGTVADPADTTQFAPLGWLAKAEVNRLAYQPNEEFVDQIVTMYEQSNSCS